MSNEYVPRYTAGVKMILDVLAAGDSPVWGKRIIHLTKMQSGSVYPALARLEQAGWVESTWEESGPGLGRPVRHYYRITGEGRARRDTENARLDAISGSISGQDAQAEVSPPPPVPFEQVPFKAAI